MKDDLERGRYISARQSSEVSADITEVQVRILSQLNLGFSKDPHRSKSYQPKLSRSSRR